LFTNRDKGIGFRHHLIDIKKGPAASILGGAKNFSKQRKYLGSGNEKKVILRYDKLF